MYAPEITAHTGFQKITTTKETQILPSLKKIADRIKADYMSWVAVFVLIVALFIAEKKIRKHLKHREEVKTTQKIDNP